MNDREDFDIMLRKMAKSEPIIVPDGFEERSDTIIKNLASKDNKANKTIGKSKWRFAFAMLLLFFSLGGIVATAQYISGGEFFKDYFNKIARNDTNNSYNYMNTEQLKGLESSTVGTVINSPEITIDVLGVIKSGNTVNVMLKITANQLDSVLYDNGIEPLKNYRFNDNFSNTLSEDAEQVSYRYYYNDEDKSLEPNQFKILYTFIGVKNLDKKNLSLELDKFGYFFLGKTSYVDFNTLYDDKWEFNVALDSVTDSYKQVYINKPIVYNNSKIILDLVNINPLSCTIKFNPVGYSDKEYSDFVENVSNFKFILSNGQIIDSKQFEYTCGGNYKEARFDVIISFKVPVTVDDIKSIALYDKEFDLK